jgi:glycosyltransferase involved in cell wall biosynthesis
MRITIDIRLLTRGGTTGIPGYTRDLIDTFITEHPEHTYTLFYNAFNKTNDLPQKWHTSPNVQIVSGRIPNRLLSLTLRTIGRPTIEQLTHQQKADLIWSPHLDLLTTSKTPQVITVHDLSFLHYPEFFSRKYKLWSWLQNQQQRAKTATRLIAVSEFTKSDLVRSLNVPAEKISVVYSGINKSFRRLEVDDAQLATYKKEKGLSQPFFLYLGSLEPRKNLPLLISAFSELKKNSFFADHQLVLAGRPGYQANHTLAAAKKSAVASDIRFLGAVDDDERVLLYNLARAFVFPSWFEGFGFPPLEAQACGVPVIGSDRTSLPEILGDSALLTDPWSVKKMTDHMQAIETDTKLRETIVALGLENAQRFNWHDAATQTNEVFKSTIN